MTSSVVLQFASKTDTGLVRSHNEDAIEVSADYQIAVLADGMGGYNAGEVASGIATAMFRSTLEQNLQQLQTKGRAASSKTLQRLLVESVASANAQILEVARAQPQFSGMGTTLVAALFHHDKVVLAHVGDSRAYRFRQGVLTQLTRDHSQLQEQIDAGLVSPEWARFAPNKNLITRALGVASQIDVEVNDYSIEAGDVYLLCSDGLSDMLASEQISAMLEDNDTDLDLLCSSLVQAANNNGGRDNISVILAKIESSAPAPLGLWNRLVARFK
ncbi:Stp1/IreP family PP2C-type Ser/Thr phosphatase [Herminiimonas arsenitoxidans]|uniref:Stp1/IreP family PP2C-type Ser/Thr phosphatase n=1 Tax=Herminiimonas arsenitoxidans TaxID=1809410 RepID=UPI000970CB3A|nr:Stp1/IreP family PP2C-type Ser/Thr phosphatase [Herminiimonas arsenitoxidans]